MKNKKIMITGGMGFIGSNLARRLVEQGARVVVIDSMIPAHGGNPFNMEGIRDRVEIHIKDVRDENILKNLVHGQDYIFNLAGQTSHMDSMTDPYTDLDINARAQLHILEACRKYNPDVKIVFASTRQVYGKPRYLPVNETHPLNPVDINGVNKLAGEWYHQLYHDVYGIRSSVLRMTNTIGPRMRIRDARQTFLGIWIRDLIQERPFEVWGGDQKRDFTFVDDAVSALLLAAERKEADGRIFNLGGTRPISLKDLAELLVRINGKGGYKVVSFPADRKRIDIDDYYADFSLVKNTLGWVPEFTLEEGLEKTIRYYKKNIEHYVVETR